VELAKVNVQKLAAGYRASKVIGRSVVNNDNETIGKIDDLLVSSGGKNPYGLRRRAHAARLPGTRGRGEGRACNVRGSEGMLVRISQAD
jgi:hypothetical protein